VRILTSMIFQLAGQRISRYEIFRRSFLNSLRRCSCLDSPALGFLVRLQYVRPDAAQRAGTPRRAGHVMKPRILNWLITLDQFLFSCLTLGSSNPDETASACAWRREQAGELSGKVFRPLLDRLFWFDPDHCRISFEDEKNHLQEPIEERQ